MREHDVVATDGTVLRAWQHGDTGPPVLISPGLGTIPEAWPALLTPDAGVRLYSWYHRGTFGSQRPVDPARVTLDDHVADGLAVLDAAGIDRCVVVCWSLGVSVGVRMALDHPDRVSGLLLVAGVPGGIFEAMLGMTRLPDRARAPLARGLTKALAAMSPGLNVVLHRWPITPRTVWPLRHSGLLLSSADPLTSAAAVRRFLQHDWPWYFRLALGVAYHPRLDLRDLRCPVTVLAGRYDLLTDVKHVTRRLGGLPQARIRVLPNTHLLPLEAPPLVLAELRLLLSRTAAVGSAVAARSDTLTSCSRPAS